METGEIGGEGSEEHVKVGGGHDVFANRFIMDFDMVLCEDVDVALIILLIVQQSRKQLGLQEFQDVSLVEMLTEFTPLGVEHYLDKSIWHTRIWARQP